MSDDSIPLLTIDDVGRELEEAKDARDAGELTERQYQRRLRVLNAALLLMKGGKVEDETRGAA